MKSIHPQTIAPGTGVIINTSTTDQNHERLKKLRALLAVKQDTHFRMAEVFQIALEKGIDVMELELNLQPTEA